MKPLSLLLLLFILSVTKAFAILSPADGATLHYRLIGFTFPVNENATSYMLEVFEHNGGKRASKPIVKKEQKGNKVIAIVPSFGKEYTWRVKYLKNKKAFDSTAFFRFTVSPNPYSDNSIAKVIVIDSASKYKDLLLFFDNTRSLHNMSGEALWFLPPIKGISDSSVANIRDVKVTSVGTITFLTSKNIHEIDYDGNVLWSGPNDGKVSGDTIEQYHHEFTRLPNGHYMVIGNKLVPSLQLLDKETVDNMPEHMKQTNPRTPCGCVIEYNAKTEVVWLWNSCDHIKEGDPSTHFNSFYLDEKNKVFYTSYRNISRVAKAAYPAGNLLAQYGEDFMKDGSIKGNDMFYAQHNVGVNSDGNMMLFNNNYKMRTALPGTNEKRISSIAVFREPVTPADTLEKIWEFHCNIDTFAKAVSAGGGSIYELDKGDYLVCMGIPGRNFIVSTAKKMLWNVVTKQKNAAGAWEPFAGYRVSPVRKQDVEKMLFR